METFDAVLTWLANGGGAVILAGWLASWLLEDWQAWHVLSSKKKKIYILLGAVILGVGGKLLYLRPELTARLRPYLDTFVLVVGAWLSTQVAYKADKAE